MARKFIVIVREERHIEIEADNEAALRRWFETNGDLTEQGGTEFETHDTGTGVGGVALGLIHIEEEL